MWLRVANVIMALLFAFAVAVQYNDPDPLQWMAIYGAAAALSAWAAWRPAAYPRAAPVVVAVIALLWAAALSPHALGKVGPGRMFERWEMKNELVEENREMFGLAIIAGWMIVLAIARRRGGPAG